MCGEYGFVSSFKNKRSSCNNNELVSEENLFLLVFLTILICAEVGANTAFYGLVYASILHCSR